eukprot:2783164-Pleurochrysis_carterae.AAC.2
MVLQCLTSPFCNTTYELSTSSRTWVGLLTDAMITLPEFSSLATSLAFFVSTTLVHRQVNTSCRHLTSVRSARAAVDLRADAAEHCRRSAPASLRSAGGQCIGAVTFNANRSNLDMAIETGNWAYFKLLNKPGYDFFLSCCLISNVI